MRDDPIGDAVAMALEQIEVHAGEARYSKPVIASRIAVVRVAMESLQRLLEEHSTPQLHVVPKPEG